MLPRRRNRKPHLCQSRTPLLRLAHPLILSFFWALLHRDAAAAAPAPAPALATNTTATASPVGKIFRLHLRNGDRVTGLWLRETADFLTVSNSLLGTLSLPLAQIERRELLSLSATPGPAPSPVAGGFSPALAEADPATLRRLNDLLAAYLSGHLSTEQYHRQRARMLADFATASSTKGAQQAGGQAATAGESPGAGAKPGAAGAARKPPTPKLWSGEAQLGTDLGFGQKKRELYTGRLKLNYVHAPIRNYLDYLFTYGRTEGDLTANRMDASMKTDFDLGRDVYAYSLEGGGYDRIRKIDWRYEVGPGIGYHLIKRTNFVLRVETGFHYEVHNFENNRQEDLYYHRLAEDLRWNLGTFISVDEKLEYLPELTHFGNYKLRLEANLKLWLRSNLYLNLSVIDLYDTESAPGVGKNDLQLRSSIGVRF